MFVYDCRPSFPGVDTAQPRAPALRRSRHRRRATGELVEAVPHRRTTASRHARAADRESNTTGEVGHAMDEAASTELPRFCPSTPSPTPWRSGSASTTSWGGCAPMAPDQPSSSNVPRAHRRVLPRPPRRTSRTVPRPCHGLLTVLPSSPRLTAFHDSRDSAADELQVNHRETAPRNFSFPS